MDDRRSTHQRKPTGLVGRRISTPCSIMLCFGPRPVFTSSDRHQYRRASDAFVARLEVYQPYICHLDEVVELIEDAMGDPKSEFGEFLRL